MMRFAALIVGVFAVVSANATTVFPTGDAARDVDNVRAAVRAGGTVLLKATDASGNPREFNFGDFPVGEIDWNDFGSGYVAVGTHGEIVPLTLPNGHTVYFSFGNDVVLRGETAGGAMTTIRGGTIPVRNFEPRDIPGVGMQTVYGMSSLRIEGIRFTESALQSIYTFQGSYIPAILDLVAARGVTLRTELLGNEFIDVQPAHDFNWYALAAVTDSPAGTVTASNNYVRFTTRWDSAERLYEAANSLPFASELWEGLSFASLRHPAEITGNTVKGVDVGLLVYFDGSEFVRVSDNLVDLDSRPEGLVGIELAANHTYLAERNTIIAGGTSPDGMILWASDPDLGINGSTVRHNRLVMNGSYFGGISLVGGGTNNYFGQNRIEGSAAYALGLVADFFGSPAPQTGNAFAGNNLSAFHPLDSPYYGSGANVFFDFTSNNNVLAGNSGIVKDLGQNNSVTGTAGKGPGPGQTLRDALAAKRDLLRHITRHP